MRKPTITDQLHASALLETTMPTDHPDNDATAFKVSDTTVKPQPQWDPRTVRPTVEPTFRPLDPVQRPAHYNRTKYEAIDVLDDMVTGWPAATAAHLWQSVKYIWRHRDKGAALQDLKKAAYYLQRAIATLEAEQSAVKVTK
jgi:hypothetical protein